jgi:DNA-binding NarL/FixJ family response regulator
MAWNIQQHLIHGHNPIRIMIVDDQDIDREVTRLGLEMQREFSVVGEAEDGCRAIELVRQLRPDVVVVDVDMPILRGPETVKSLKAQFPDLITIGYSVHDEREVISEMLGSGAKACLSKKEGVIALARKIRNCCLSPELREAEHSIN